MPDSILKKFLSGMLATGIGSISVIVLGMLGLMLSARLLPADALGAFFVLQVVVVFATESSAVGIGIALERWLPGASDTDQERRILNTALHFRALTVVIGGIALALAIPTVLERLDLTSTPSLIAVLLAWFALEALLKLVLTHHQAHFAFRAIGGTNVLSSTANFAGILLFVLNLEQGLLGLLYAKLMSRSLALIYAWLAKPLSVALVFDLQLLRQMLRYALPLYGNYFLSFLSMRADTLLIGGMLGTTAVAYYEVARRIPDSLLQLYEAFRQVYFPFVVRGIANGHLDQVSALINHSTRFGALGLGFACLIAFAFGEPILVALFSATYLPSVLPFALLMVTASLLMIESTLGSALAAMGDSEKPFFINTFRTLLQLGAYFALIPELDISGAALAALLAAAAVLPINVFFLRRRALTVHPLGYTKPLLIAIALAISLWLAGPKSPPLILLMVLAYIPAIFMFSAIKKTELQAATTWFVRRSHNRFRPMASGSAEIPPSEWREPSPSATDITGAARPTRGPTDLCPTFVWEHEASGLPGKDNLGLRQFALGESDPNA